MAFANPERKEKSINKKTVKKNNPNIRDILIDPNKIDCYKTFSEEIPDEFKYTGIHGRLGKLKLGDKSARDRWSLIHKPSWDRIPKDAKKLDNKRTNHQKATLEVEKAEKAVKVEKEVKTEKAAAKATAKAAEKLKDDSFHYIDKNKNYAKDTDEYTNDDSSAKVIITKRTLVAKKMINKVVSEIEDSGNFINNNIDEGAQNVTLKPGTERNTDKRSFLEKLTSSPFLRWRDRRKKKLFEHDPKPEDCRQIAIGDCWLQTGLIDILKKKGPKPIKDIFKDEGASGYVQIRLYYPKGKRTGSFDDWNWVPKYYRIQKRIPAIKFTKIPIYNWGALWVHYFEAAVAKSNIRNKRYNELRTEKVTLEGNTSKIRDYSSIDGGWPQSVWKMVFGNNVHYYTIDDDYIMKDMEAEQNNKFMKVNNKLQQEIDVVQQKTDLTKEQKDAGENRIIKKYEDKLKKWNANLDDDKNASLREKLRGITNNNIYIRIQNAINNNKLVALHFNHFAKKVKRRKFNNESVSRGLVSYHSYTVCGCEEKDGIKYLSLINPWHTRTGRMYNKYNKKGKKHSFKRKGNESFKVKLSTVMKHMSDISVEK